MTTPYSPYGNNNPYNNPYNHPLTNNEALGLAVGVAWAAQRRHQELMAALEWASLTPYQKASRQYHADVEAWKVACKEARQKHEGAIALRTWALNPAVRWVAAGLFSVIGCIAFVRGAVVSDNGLLALGFVILTLVLIVSEWFKASTGRWAQELRVLRASSPTLPPEPQWTSYFGIHS